MTKHLDVLKKLAKKQEAGIDTAQSLDWVALAAYVAALEEVAAQSEHAANYLKELQQ